MVVVIPWSHTSSCCSSVHHWDNVRLIWRRCSHYDHALLVWHCGEGIGCHLQSLEVSWCGVDGNKRRYWLWFTASTAGTDFALAGKSRSPDEQDSGSKTARGNTTLHSCVHSVAIARWVIVVTVAGTVSIVAITPRHTVTTTNGSSYSTHEKCNSEAGSYDAQDHVGDDLAFGFAHSSRNSKGSCYDEQYTAPDAMTNKRKSSVVVVAVHAKRNAIEDDAETAEDQLRGAETNGQLVTIAVHLDSSRGRRGLQVNHTSRKRRHRWIGVRMHCAVLILHS